MIIKILKNQYLWLGLILAIAFAARFYKIDNPVADWHSWRQADTAAVARNFYKIGFNPFVPIYDDMSAVSETPMPNPNRYRFVEFPIYNSLVYLSYLLNGGVDEKLARLVSIFMSLGSTIFIFLMVKKYWGGLAGFLSALTFGILPFNIYFSRVILPEPTLVFFSMGMVYFVDRWIFENTAKLFFLSVIFTACAFLTKPAAVFFALPLFYSFFRKERRLWPIPKRYFIFLFLSLAPFGLWRWWMGHYPEGIPASSWLFNGNGIRFRPAFWKWIVGDRLGREILTGSGMVLFFIGLLKKPSGKEGLFLHLFIISSLLYLVVFATGNVQHDYYQTLIIPALSIGVGGGLAVLVKGIACFIPRIWSIPLAFTLFSLTIYLGWTEVKGLYQVNNWAIVEAGREADMILPKNAIVVAPYGGDTAFLYQTNRPGFPVMASSIEDLKKRFGVTSFVSVNMDDDTRKIIAKYNVLEKNTKFVIVDVTHFNPNFKE